MTPFAEADARLSAMHGYAPMAQEPTVADLLRVVFERLEDDYFRYRLLKAQARTSVTVTPDA